MQHLVSSLSVSGRPVHRLRDNWCAPDGHLLKVTIPEAASIQSNLLMMSIQCSKHVEDYNKRIVKYSKFVSSWSLSKINSVRVLLKCIINSKEWNPGHVSDAHESLQHYLLQGTSRQSNISFFFLYCMCKLRYCHLFPV